LIDLPKSGFDSRLFGSQGLDGGGVCRHFGGMKRRNKNQAAKPSKRLMKPLSGEKRCSAIAAAVALRRPGASFPSAAEQAGVTDRTLRHWRDQAWWAEIEDEASAGETAELVRIAVESLRQNMPGDGKLALRVAERLDPRFAPATQRHEVKVEGFEIDLMPPAPGE
jgi:transposase-like protein